MISQTLFVPIDLDRPRKLRFDINFLANLEDEYDESFSRIFKRFQAQEDDTLTDFGLRDLRKILRAALIHQEPGITLADVGAMLTGRDIAAVTKILIDGLAASMGGPSTGGKSEAPSASGVDGTGKKPDGKPLAP